MVAVRDDDAVLADGHGVELDVLAYALGVAGLEVESEGEGAHERGRKQQERQKEAWAGDRHV